WLQQRQTRDPERAPARISPLPDLHCNRPGRASGSSIFPIPPEKSFAVELGLAKQQGAEVERASSTATRLTIGVTSHRTLKAGEPPLSRERVRAFFTALTRDFPTLPMTVLSALA